MKSTVLHWLHWFGEAMVHTLGLEQDRHLQPPPIGPQPYRDVPTKHQGLVRRHKLSRTHHIAAAVVAGLRHGVSADPGLSFRSATVRATRSRRMPLRVE